MDFVTHVLALRSRIGDLGITFSALDSLRECLLTYVRRFTDDFDKYKNNSYNHIKEALSIFYKPTSKLVFQSYLKPLPANEVVSFEKSSCAEHKDETEGTLDHIAPSAILDASAPALHSFARRCMDMMHRVLEAQAVRISRRLKTQVCSRCIAFFRTSASDDVVSTKCIVAAVTAQCTAIIGI